MRVSREEKDRSHKRILEASARLLRERGAENTSVGDVMASAGLTHGGFYRHFESKEDLVAATIRETFDATVSALESRSATVGPREGVKDYFDHYLSDEHLTNPGLGCPIPALGAEIARAPETLKAEFGASFNRALTAIAKGLPGAERAAHAKAMRELAMRVGAIVIARACDPATAQDVLQACRKPRRRDQRAIEKADAS